MPNFVSFFFCCCFVDQTHKPNAKITVSFLERVSHLEMEAHSLSVDVTLINIHDRAAFSFLMANGNVNMNKWPFYILGSPSWQNENVFELTFYCSSFKKKKIVPTFQMGRNKFLNIPCDSPELIGVHPKK